MPTRNVVLTKHHEEVIEKLVKSGRYQNASEVLRDGFRLTEQRDAIEVAKLAALREAVRIGFGDIDADRFQDVGDVELETFIASLGRQASERLRTSGK